MLSKEGRGGCCKSSKNKMLGSFLLATDRKAPEGAFTFLTALLLLASLSSLGFAQLEQPEDTRLGLVQCWGGGAEIPRNDLDALWNPSQDVQEVPPSKGPPFSLRWSGSGELRCRWTFKEVQPWNGFEAELASGSARLVSVRAGGTEILERPQEMSAGKKVRAQARKTLGVREVEATFHVSGNSINLAEVSALPPTLDTVAVPTLEDDYRNVFFPSDFIKVFGDTTRRTYVCSGGRNTCLWVSKEECRKRGSGIFSGYAYKCSFRCPPAGTNVEEDVRYLSSNEFSSGKCEDKGWGKTAALVAGTLLMIVAPELGPLLGAAFQWVAFIGGAALSSWNPGIPLGDQWMTLALSAARSVAFSLLGGGLPPSSSEQVARMEQVATAAADIGLSVAIPTVAEVILFRVGTFVVGYAFNNFVLAPLTDKLIQNMESPIASAFVSQFSAALGAGVANLVGNAVAGQISDGLSNYIKLEMGTSITKLADTGFGDVFAASLERELTRLMTSTLRGAATQLASQPIGELCANSLKGSAQIGVGSACGLFAKSFSDWMLFEDKGAWLKEFGIENELPSVSFKRVLDSFEPGFRNADMQTAGKLAEEDLAALKGVTSSLPPDIEDAIKAAPNDETNILRSRADGIRTYRIEEMKKLLSEDKRFTEKLTANERELWIKDLETPDKAGEPVLAGEFAAKVGSWQLSNDLLKWRDQASGMLRFVLENAQAQRDVGRYAEEAQKQLEATVQGQSCACFGQLRASTQFLQDSVACTRSDTGLDSTTVGRPLSLIKPDVAATVGPPGSQVQGITEFGQSWCRPSAAQGQDPREEGSVAVSVSASPPVTQGFGHYTRSGAFGVTLKAPSRPGGYRVTATASDAATSELSDSIRRTLEAVEAVLDNPFRLGDARDAATSLAEAMSAAGLSSSRARIAELAGIFDSVLGSGLVVSSAGQQRMSQASSDIARLEGEARSLNSQAASAGHSTDLPDLVSKAASARQGLQSFLGSPRGSSALAAGQSLLDMDSEITGVETETQGSLKALQDLRDRLGGLKSTGADYTWEETANTLSVARILPMFLGVEARRVGRATTGQLDRTFEVEYFYDRISVIDDEFGFQRIGEKTLGGEVGLPSKTFALDLRGLTQAIDSTVAEIAALESATQSAAAAANPGDSSFRQRLASIDNLRGQLVSRADRLRGPILGLAGEVDGDTIKQGIFIHEGLLCRGARQDLSLACDAVEGRIKCPGNPFLEEIASFFCTIAPVQENVLVEERQPLAQALLGVRMLDGAADALKAARDRATAAVWAAKLRGTGVLIAGRASAGAARVELSSLLGQSLDSRESSIRTKVEQADLQRLLAGGFVEGGFSLPIDVVRPELEIGGAAVACGAGEVKPFELNISAGMRWPIVSVQGGVWTPFSVPYQPKKPITLSDIGPGCNVQQLGWRDLSGANRRSGAAAAREALIPGRGYYVITSNNCQLGFSAGLFEPNGRINLGNSRSIGQDLSLIGSTSRVLPFDAESLSHKLDPSGLLGLGIEELNANCKPLRIEIYDTFNRERKSTEWTELREARPVSFDPFENPTRTADAGSHAEFVHPGRAYWVQTNYGRCSLRDTMAAPLPSALYGIPRDVNFDVSYSLPAGWTTSDWQDGLLDSQDFVSCNQPNCVGIGNRAKQVKGVRPASTRELGEHFITVVLKNETLGIRRETIRRYYLASPKAVAQITRTQIGEAVSIGARVTHDAPIFCEARKFSAQIEKPQGWRVGSALQATIKPGEQADLNWTLSPVPGRAQSGIANILITPELSDQTRLSKGEIFEACVPGERARSLASNDTHLIYATDFEIRAFNTRACEAAGTLLNESGRDIDFANGTLVWLDEAGGIKKLENGTAKLLVSASSATEVATDGQSIYWLELGTIRMMTADGSVSLRASGLAEAQGLDVDATHVWWTEGSSVKRVPKTGSCIGECETFARISGELVGPLPGRLTDVASADGAVFAVVNNTDILPDVDHSKIIRIDVASKNITVIAKPLLFGSSAGSLATDGSYAYWIGDGIADRVNAWLETTLVQEFVGVAGHRPATVALNETSKAAPAGTLAKFDVIITNRNDPGLLPERFWIQDVQLSAGLKLCVDGFFAACEDDPGQSRALMLDEYSLRRTRPLAVGESASLSLWLKAASGLSAGTSLQFTVRAGSIDTATIGSAAGELRIVPPGPPLVEVIPVHG
jgi:hypothetical protein